MEPAVRKATYQDVLDAPENMVAELIDGELHLQPRPAKPHAQVSSVLGAQLVTRFQLGQGGPGGWWIIDEPEIHFDSQVLVPDLAGWRLQNTPDFDWTLAYYTERPDWVCEVLSPSTARIDRIKKLEIYRQAEIEWAWLVDPLAHTIEIYRWSEQGWLRTQVVDGEEAASLEPFEAVPLELALIWPPVPR